MHNLKNYLILELQRLSRNKKYFLFTIGIPCFMYFFVTKVFMQGIPAGLTKDLAFKGYLISMSIVSVLSTLLFGYPATIISNRKDGWNKLMDKVSLSKRVYFFSIGLINCLIFMVSIASLFTVVFFVDHISFGLVKSLMIIILIVIGMFFFVPLAVLLCNFKKIENANMFANLIFMFFGFLGGLYIPLESMPTWIANITKWTPSYHFLSLVLTYVNEGTINLEMLAKLAVFAGLFLLLAGKFYSDNEKY